MFSFFTKSKINPSNNNRTRDLLRISILLCSFFVVFRSVLCLAPTSTSSSEQNHEQTFTHMFLHGHNLALNSVTGELTVPNHHTDPSEHSDHPNSTEQNSEHGFCLHHNCQSHSASQLANSPYMPPPKVLQHDPITPDRSFPKGQSSSTFRPPCA